MKLLFNKNNDGAEQLQQLTGSYYANNDFARIQTDILLESEKIVKLIGKDVYALAANFYHTPPDGSSVDQEEIDQLEALLQHIQLPISLMATYRYYQTNIMSHEDGGRKLKVDKDNEATPWEWMFDRDDDAQLHKAFSAIDRLISFLDETQFEEWRDSPQQKATRKLFVNNAQVFHDVYPIDQSPRFYHSIVPFIAEVQRDVILKALGKERFDTLMEAFQSMGNESGSSPVELDETDALLIDLVQRAIPLLTMSIAAKRLSIKVMPEGVVQQFKSMLQGRSASQPPLPAIIAEFTEKLDQEALKAVNEIKREIKKATPEALVYDLAPKNSEDNKFFSL